jgi:hypothetical protein
VQYFSILVAQVCYLILLCDCPLTYEIGGSGTGQIYQQSAVFSTILKGQYDLIGFDPRGVNKSSVISRLFATVILLTLYLVQPYVSCFPSAFDQQAFALASNGLSLELPSKAQANVSDLSFPVVKHDLRRQIALHRAQIDNLAVQCKERTGDAIAFMGAEFFVRDMDYLSKLIEGEHKPINCTWFFLLCAPEDVV